MFENIVFNIAIIALGVLAFASIIVMGVYARSANRRADVAEERVNFLEYLSDSRSAKIYRLENALNASEVERLAYKAENVELIKLVESRDNLVTDLNEDFKYAKKLLKNAEIEGAEKSEMISSLDKYNASILKSLSEANHKINEYEMRVNALSRVVHGLREQIGNLSRKQEVAELQRELESAVKSLEVSKARNVKLRNRLVWFAKSHGAMFTDYNDLVVKIDTVRVAEAEIKAKDDKYERESKSAAQLGIML